MQPRAESGKTSTQLSLCWSEENDENSYLCGPGRGQERPQHNLAFVGVKKIPVLTFGSEFLQWPEDTTFDLDSGCELMFKFIKPWVSN